MSKNFIEIALFRECIPILQVVLNLTSVASSNYLQLLRNGEWYLLCRNPVPLDYCQNELLVSFGEVSRKMKYPLQKQQGVLSRIPV